MNHYSFNELSIGMKESFKARVTAEKMESFRIITGDENPLHNDEAYAKGLGYADRVAFGMLTASYMSTIAGVYLPGEKSLIQSVESKFLKPVLLGDELTVTGEISDINETVKQLEIKVTIVNQNGTKVMKGRMKVLVNE